MLNRWMLLLAAFTMESYVCGAEPKQGDVTRRTWVRLSSWKWFIYRLAIL